MGETWAGGGWEIPLYETLIVLLSNSISVACVPISEIAEVLVSP